MAHRTTPGFTIVELLVVLAIVGVLAGLSVMIGYDTIARSTVARERDTLVSLLMGARTQSLANVDQSAHGVRIESAQFVVFEGTSFAAGTKKQATPRTPEVTIPTTDVIFEALSGNVLSGAGDIHLSDNQSSATVTINDAGGIEW